jgi:hypothetical protein
MVDSDLILNATLKVVEACTQDQGLQLLGLSALSSLARAAPDEVRVIAPRLCIERTRLTHHGSLCV